MSAIFTAFWFFLPAGLANVIPVFAAHIPGLRSFSYPLDFYLRLNGKRILGSHKTWRGIILGTLTGAMICNLQKNLYLSSEILRSNLMLDYTNMNTLILGSLLGLGALTGDAIKSFFKRLSGVNPGKSWLPFDQMDYILGGISFSLIYIQINLSIYLWIFILYFILHPLTTTVGYLLKLKTAPI